MIKQQRNGTIVVRICCAVFFLLFSFLYLYEYQADVLSATQHVLSGGVTHYNRVVGAVLITLVLWLLQGLVRVATRLGGYLHAPTYLPSLLLLGILTDVSHDIETATYIGHWFWLFPLLMLVYGGVVWLCRPLQCARPIARGGNLLSAVWVNMLSLTTMSLFTCMIGNHDRLFHYRLHAETQMLACRYVEAAMVGARDEKTDSSLTLLRIWALSRQGKLGESLFEYPLAGGSDAMLPNRSSVRLVMLSEKALYRDLGGVFREHLRPIDYLKRLHQTPRATRASHDWLLCAGLLDCDLDAFAQTLPTYRNIKAPLPKHYREALTLYTHMRNNPLVVFKDSIMEADYEGFQAIRRNHADERTRHTLLKDNYGKTYWFYYYTRMDKR